MFAVAASRGESSPLTKERPAHGQHHGVEIGGTSLNALVTGDVPKVRFLTTRGHGDTISIMKVEGRHAGLDVDHIQDMTRTAMPCPLVPVHLNGEHQANHQATDAERVSLRQVRAGGAEPQPSPAQLGETTRIGEGLLAGDGIVVCVECRTPVGSPGDVLGRALWRGNDPSVAELTEETRPTLFAGTSITARQALCPGCHVALHTQVPVAAEPRVVAELAT